MSFFAAHPGLVVLGVCFLAALVLAVLGIARLARAANRLKKRVATYSELPIRKDLELAEARLAAAQRRAASLPSLLARSRNALLEIEAARAKVVVIKTALGTLLRLSGLLLPGR